MMISGYDRVELSQYLRRTAQRMRHTVRNNPYSAVVELSRLADELDLEAGDLERDLVRTGNRPEVAANQRG